MNVKLADIGWGAGLIAHAPKKQPGLASEARTQAIDRLEQVKAHFQTLLDGNWSTARTDYPYDAAIFPVLVAAENARSPNANLVLLPPEQDFGAWLKKERPSNARVMFTMPGLDDHAVVADVRCVHGKTSVLVVEPLGLTGKKQKAMLDKYKDKTLPALRQTLGSDVTLSVLTLDTQKSTNDCWIFGLSAASKLADNAAFLDKLHKQNLSRAPIKTTLGQKAEVLAGAGAKIQVLDGTGMLPPAFVKHSQSKTTLNKWLAASSPAYAAAGVNKAGQSLTERFDAHKTTRYDAPVNARFMQENLPEIEISVPTLTLGNSIEEKRLTYLDRAIEYLKSAPESECSRLVESLAALDIDPPGPGNLHLDDRDWGPDPKTLA